jgi:lysozyme
LDRLVSCLACCLALVLGAAVPFPARSADASGAIEGTRGFDVSHYQGKVRWDLIPRDGLNFVFVKATGGTNHVDPEFNNNWHGAREAGLPRGAYHFFCGQDDAEVQAEHFANTVIRLKADDLPPVLDVEVTDGVSQQQLLDGVVVWLKAVERRLGRRPILYTGRAFAEQYLTDVRLSGYALWLAAYREQAPSAPSVWQEQGWMFWQHSQNGALVGVETNVALSIFHGSAQDLQKFIRTYQTGQ